MYVCLCHALTDRDIDACCGGDDGGTVSSVYRALGLRPQCGKCVPMVRQIVREATAAAGDGAGMR